ncbi:MAG: HAD-IB family phosphatase, partial [Dehalococcoidales bacterium]|nr:HAD-IB family phosphatase [Dehalococcoidales bacterium]
MTHSTETPKTMIQCDFDGTVTEEDVSFTLLDTFADGNWRERLKDYQSGKISVGRFNTEAFAMIKANRASLVKVAQKDVRIRAGFSDFHAYCQRKGIRLVIVSNGLDFYIEEILRDVGIEDIKISAARTHFRPEGLEVKYIGPDGSRLENDFKGAYLTSFLSEGYRVLYAGNG